ncbi:hypothetical protein [Mangrovicoccus algicola]|uniref:Uncharacterized protein n=1 Tax=Mangrovicoccus algicola TaxID=2771008 RepID=A0A8J6Z820_9RHOB|nr:hypothetical protein [Mangrovicoccus algicola]MBE3637526.1 hypothetical protein [Mangrovicoccus algicola]
MTGAVGGRRLALTAWYGSLAIIGGCLAVAVETLRAGLEFPPPPWIGQAIAAAALMLPLLCAGIGLRLHLRAGRLPGPVVQTAVWALAGCIFLLTWVLIGQ